ncbi:hypothetical protein B0H10DRAFT_2225837 [Mycena sp. CBHHK59/15]|nr:hypothetical protein B0H10DRAFT_2225837 [Mycena sp. CBHHK59/15]
MARTRQPRRNPVLERLRRIRNGIHQTRALLALGRSPYKHDGPGGVYIQLRLDPDNHHQLQAKYGHTKNFARRRQQYKKCEQNGHGLWFWGIVYSRHRMLAERIIHLVLAAQGRRARVVRCPGCGVNHREFFTVGAGGMVELEFWLWLGVALAGFYLQTIVQIARAPSNVEVIARDSSAAPARERRPAGANAPAPKHRATRQSANAHPSLNAAGALKRAPTRQSVNAPLSAKAPVPLCQSAPGRQRARSRATRRISALSYLSSCCWWALQRVVPFHFALFLYVPLDAHFPVPQALDPAECE